ncbi:hypothetical protein H6P81_009191 [Aristolochia fimbriata]|uniref:Uncharacterized protein n=1 Tax=Aristolochia fimbriata TaxID=158543 RepID=A0AAV7ELC7_ARIFI|nr:hypothetical protein H6P81_009191 [Aristolochia fimbriata]
MWIAMRRTPTLTWTRKLAEKKITQERMLRQQGVPSLRDYYTSWHLTRNLLILEYETSLYYSNSTLATTSMSWFMPLQLVPTLSSQGPNSNSAQPEAIPSPLVLNPNPIPMGTPIPHPPCPAGTHSDHGYPQGIGFDLWGKIVNLSPPQAAIHQTKPQDLSRWKKEMEGKRRGMTGDCMRSTLEGFLSKLWLKFPEKVNITSYEGDSSSL